MLNYGPDDKMTKIFLIVFISNITSKLSILSFTFRVYAMKLFSEIWKKSN